jgi:protein phosphatase 1 regulatory subunit 21
MYSSTSTPPSTPTSTSTAESKFSKLSLEYAKLRAQFGVVKKAVIEEQAKNADIGDKMRESNMDRRRMEMELDAVTFRNQQLTKRIHVLQEEMDVGVGGGGGGGKKAARNKSEAVQNSESLNSVIGQELAAKIDENERLHARLSTVDAKYDEVINKLNSRIRELEAEVRRKSQEDRAEDSKQKELINGLKTDNVALMKKARLAQYIARKLGM